MNKGEDSVIKFCDQDINDSQTHRITTAFKMNDGSNGITGIAIRRTYL